MSDVKKLIAEARGYQGQDEYGLVDLAHRLADALEAAAPSSDDTEWEYGCMSSTHRYSPHRSGWGIPIDPMVRPEEHGEICPSPALARRRPAGPWVAIEKGGESNE